MKRIYHMIILLISMFIAGTAVRAEDIRYAIFPAPPYMIGADKNTGTVTGIDVEIVSEIARRMNLSVTFIRAPWVRCLELMKEGSADILSSVYMTLSRKSPFAGRLKEFNAVNNALLNEGFISRTIRKYYERYR